MNYFKQCLLSGILVFFTLEMSGLFAADSTSVTPIAVLPAVTNGYVLAHGEIPHSSGSQQNFMLTIPNKRCAPNTTPFIGMAPQRAVNYKNYTLMEFNVYPYDHQGGKSSDNEEPDNGKFVEVDFVSGGYKVFFRASDNYDSAHPAFAAHVAVTWTLYCIP